MEWAEAEAARLLGPDHPHSRAVARLLVFGFTCLALAAAGLVIGAVVLLIEVLV